MNGYRKQASARRNPISAARVSDVVRDFDVVDIALLPPETNPELIASVDAVLSTTRAFERFEAIARRNCEFSQLPDVGITT